MDLCESMGLYMDLILYEDSIKYDFWVKAALIFPIGNGLMVLVRKIGDCPQFYLILRLTSHWPV